MGSRRKNIERSLDRAVCVSLLPGSGTMSSRFTTILLAIAGGFLALPGNAAALADRSPFLSRTGQVAQGIAESANSLELRGVMSGPWGFLYYIFDPAKKRGVWAGPNEADNPFVIVSDISDGGLLDVRMTDGRLLSLRLRDGKVETGGQGGGSAEGLAQGSNPDGTPIEAEPRLSEAEKR